MKKQQAALKREMEPDSLGKALSDMMTKRIIVAILLMLMVIPALTYSQFDNTLIFGLREVFWFGRSSCARVNGNMKCGDEWVSSTGWQELLRRYSVSARYTENIPPSKNLLWLHVPNFEKGGIIEGNFYKIKYRY